MLKQLLNIPFYKSFYAFGRPKILPFSYTISVTFKCNSRCRTCYIWERNVPEFTLEEFDKTFFSLKKSPYWVTISSGEPFLRNDTVDIIKSLYTRCAPKVINIPTNGILYKTIPEKVEEILAYCNR